ncbi:hypothetical protein ACFW5D_36880 [Streptomyces sp. NPDC058770]|uniref:hypothetical protein n=1 Tax=unclassified Streptomyces TaxID=2593676 RepID=UPI000938B4F6|nr:hypothetical protein [Streptomyces sp. CB01580]OKJ18416.1 hypothetical protein AMK22_35505 [Streptomyces sp. CB01580]
MTQAFNNQAEQYVSWRDAVQPALRMLLQPETRIDPHLEILRLGAEHKDTLPPAPGPVPPTGLPHVPPQHNPSGHPHPSTTVGHPYAPGPQNPYAQGAARNPYAPGPQNSYAQHPQPPHRPQGPYGG